MKARKINKRKFPLIMYFLYNDNSLYKSFKNNTYFHTYITGDFKELTPPVPGLYTRLSFLGHLKQLSCKEVTEDFIKQKNPSLSILYAK